MIDYVNLVECDTDKLLTILNSQDVRKHLMPHDQFNPESLTNRIAQKNDCPALAGCRIRGIIINQQLAGWCGIQNDDLGFEIEIVLDKPFWGHGKHVFETILS